jgi:hypothetical protein
MQGAIGASHHVPAGQHGQCSSSALRRWVGPALASPGPPIGLRGREIVDEAATSGVPGRRRLRSIRSARGSRRDRGVIGDLDREIRAALRRAGVAGRDEQALAKRA